MTRALLLTLILFSLRAHGFADMVRHGFPNCISCHTSATGGGLLTEYGRSISAELLSTWKSPGEERFVYAMKPSEVVSLGGDLRTALFQQNRATVRSTQILLMHADVEAGVTLGPVTAVATAGIDNHSSPISRRHYVQYRANDDLTLRAGRFLPAFGINVENHSIATRKGIGRNQASETYNFEAAWSGEQIDAFATAVFGRPDAPSLGAESGLALSGGILLDERFKVGVSYYYGSRDISKRHLMGPYAILGFTPRFYMLLDIGFQLFSPLTGPVANVQQQGTASYFRLDYELIQGFHAYLTQEFAQLDFRKSATGSEAYGVGLQWFPRPHWELNLLFQKQRVGGPSAKFADVVFLLVHFYL